MILKDAPFFLLGPGHNPMAHPTPVAGNAAAQEDRALREPPPRLQRQGAAEWRRQEPLQVSSVRVVASAPRTAAAITTLFALAAPTLAALGVDELDRHVPAFPILHTKKKSNSWGGDIFTADYRYDFLDQCGNLGHGKVLDKYDIFYTNNS
jgi:hypothetical protein